MEFKLAVKYHQVGFNDEGNVTGLKLNMMSDSGHIPNEASVGFQVNSVQNCYYIPNFMFQPTIVSTDTAANTWCRTPGMFCDRNIYTVLCVFFGVVIFRAQFKRNPRSTL